MRNLSKQLLCATLLASAYTQNLSAMEYKLHGQQTERVTLLTERDHCSTVRTPSTPAPKSKNSYTALMAVLKTNEAGYTHDRVMAVFQYILSAYKDEIQTEDLAFLYEIGTKEENQLLFNEFISTYFGKVLELISQDWKSKGPNSRSIPTIFIVKILEMINNPAIHSSYKDTLAELLYLDGAMVFSTPALSEALGGFLERTGKEKFKILLHLVENAGIDWEHQPTKIMDMILEALDGPSLKIPPIDDKLSMVHALLSQKLYKKHYLESMNLQTANRHYHVLSKWAYIHRPENPIVRAFKSVNLPLKGLLYYKVPKTAEELREGLHLPELGPKLGTKSVGHMLGIYQAWSNSKATLTKSNASSLLWARYAEAFGYQPHNDFLKTFFATPNRFEGTQLDCLLLSEILEQNRTKPEDGMDWEATLWKEYFKSIFMGNINNLPDFEEQKIFSRPLYEHIVRAWKEAPVVIGQANYLKLFPNNQLLNSHKGQKFLEPHRFFLKEIFGDASKFEGTDLTEKDLQILLAKRLGSINKRQEVKEDWKSEMVNTLFPKIVFLKAHPSEIGVSLLISSLKHHNSIQSIIDPLMLSLADESFPFFHKKNIMPVLRGNIYYEEHYKNLTPQEQKRYSNIFNAIEDGPKAVFAEVTVSQKASAVTSSPELSRKKSPFEVKKEVSIPLPTKPFKEKSATALEVPSPFHEAQQQAKRNERSARKLVSRSNNPSRTVNEVPKIKEDLEIPVQTPLLAPVRYHKKELSRERRAAKRAEMENVERLNMECAEAESVAVNNSYFAEAKKLKEETIERKKAALAWELGMNNIFSLFSPQSAWSGILAVNTREK